MNVKAVILAAGRGVRLQQTAGVTPKSLLPLGPSRAGGDDQVTFMERQIQCLQKAGVSEIAVVVGYHKEQMYEKLKNLDVSIIENEAPDISDSGSLHSFQYASNSSFNPLDSTSQTLLLDADIVYEQKVLSQYVQNLKNTSLLVSPVINTDSEEVRIYGSLQEPQFIGKGLTASMTKQLTCLGEATGIVHFAPEDHSLVKEVMDWLLGDPKAEEGSLKRKGFGAARQETEHEELTQRLMMLGYMEAVLMEEGLLFMEVDFDAEYQEAVHSFYPQVLEADAK